MKMDLGVKRKTQPRLLINASAGAVVKHVVGAFLLTIAASISAGDVRDIELRRLFAPTPAEIVSEAEGRIYIYDGLTDRDVQRALDEEFERVENMMFIRTQKTNGEGDVKHDEETGEVEYEDDGC